MDILNLLEKSKTSYHSVAECAAILKGNGFTELNEKKPYTISENGRYYVIRNGSSLIAFTTGDKDFGRFNIVASHTDSPCFKIKLAKTQQSANCEKLLVEQYGGGLRYSWFDRPLKLCGRLCGEKDGKVYYSLFESEQKFVIPSVAIHLRRNVNDSFSVNVQTDCPPLFSFAGESFIDYISSQFDGKLLDADLFLVCDEKPFLFGLNNEFACSPRVDNLTSCFSSIEALIDAKQSPTAINVAYLADNEEIGSRTQQGAASKFLYDTLSRISERFGFIGEQFSTILANSFFVSCDNAHATHPNHPELSETISNVTLGGGVVIKHHANQNYTTDGLSSSIFKSVLIKNNLPYCDFYVKSDMPCGGTLGAISLSQISVNSIDIGIAQLAMHSASETFAIKDYETMVKALTAFFNSQLNNSSYCETIIK